VTLVVEIFAKQAAQQKIELSCSIAGERALLVLGDRERIHEVLTRLLDNALKFTPEDGQVRVEVSGLDDSVEVAIGGSGKGVPLEDRETILEPFHQVGDHLTEKPPGTGLGLAICRGFIDGMGGAIWCEESELGGAKFRFALPAASDAIA
jgi:signal transduction histidine kinase